MASLGDVGDLLRRVLDLVDQSISAHHRAAELAGEARDLLAAAASGTEQADVEQACAQFTRVIEGISEPEGQASLLATAAEGVRSYARTAGIPEVPADAVAAQKATTSHPGGPGSMERAAKLRSRLPPQIEPGSGQKTHGLWFADGQEQAIALASGRDETSQAIDDLLHDEYGLPANRRLSRTGDVEQKVAMQMRQRGIRHAVVAINNLPCRGQFSCETLLPVILPAGSTLTVYGTNGYRRTFAGGQQPPWKR